MNRLVWILAIAVIYALSGKAGLLLAIPPGYATAVWPPSGIAAAALLLQGLWLWPGVLLGSFAVNLWTSGDFSTASTLTRSLMIAGGIGAGAALQAVLAASLVRMAVAHLNIFRLETGVIRLLLIAGPVACIVNATIGVSTLFIAGLVPAEGFLFNWWTWWIGDSIGVLIFLPLILIWNQRPYAEWWNKQVTVSAPTVLIFIAVVCLFFITSAKEESRIRSGFEEMVDGAGREFAQSVSNVDDALRSIVGFIESNPDFSAEATQRFTETLLERNSALDDLQYVRSGVEGMELSEALDGSSPALLSQYLSPSDNGLYAHEAPTLFAPDPLLLASMQAAITQRQPVIVLLPAPRQDRVTASVKAVRPVFGAGSGSARLNPDGDDQPVGFLVASIKYDEIAWGAFQRLQGIDYALEFDASTGQHGRIVDFHKPGSEQEGIKVEYVLRQGAGSIRIVFSVAASYFVEHRSWQAWGLLAVGLIFTAMLCMVMLVLIGREARVEEIVAEKTRQLRRERHQISNLMSTFPDPHFVTDDSGFIIELNEAALRVLGQQRSELIGTPVQAYFEGNIMQLIKTQVDQLPKDRFETARAVFLKSFDRRLIPAAVHVSTFRSEDTPLFAITVRTTS